MSGYAEEMRQTSLAGHQNLMKDSDFTSSWLNLIESYFATLQKTGLDNTNYKSPEEIDHALQEGVQ